MKDRDTSCPVAGPVGNQRDTRNDSRSKPFRKELPDIGQVPFEKSSLSFMPTLVD
jgi:hypothetical protein